MGWLDRLRSRSKPDVEKTELWKTCQKCAEVILLKDLIKNLYLCPKCDFHFRMPVWDRIASLTDDNTFVEFDKNIESTDPLEFVDSMPYPERLKKAIESTDSYEAVTCGEAQINGIKVNIAVMNFDFMGGSMGSVVGEKITRLFERSLEKKIPAICVSASGGARMQEGIYSLMQMAKTSAAISRLNIAGIPYISILTDPTTGGVSASFATLGDVNIAEPDALIGFAGPRVIEQTIRQKLPEGFQKSEFLLKHGMIDMIVHRKQLKQTVTHLLELLL